MLSLAVSACFAVLFSSSASIGGDVLNHNLGSSATSFSASHTATDLVFTSPGDFGEVTLALNNSSSGIYHYYFGIALLATPTPGLENAIMVYFDGQFIGTLGALCGNGESKVDNGLYILSGSVSTPQTQTHKLKFELHIGAKASYFSSKTCKINVISYAETTDAQKVSVIKNESELDKVIDDINYSNVSGRTIILANNITLTKNHTISKPCVIDLRGCELNFSNFNIYLTQSGVVKLLSSKEISPLTTGTGKFILNSLGSTLDIGLSASLYSQKVDISLLNGVRQFDKQASYDIINHNFNKKLGSGLASGQSVNLFDGMSYLVDCGDIEIIAQTDDYTYNANTKTITAKLVVNSINTYVTLGGQKIAFKIIGSGEDVFQSIINNELKHIPNKTTQNGVESYPDITYDLYLPTSIKSKNATIKWHSSNQDLIANDGKIGKFSQGKASLIAEIKINSKIYTKEYSFNIVKQNNKMKFDYLLALLNPITLAEIYPAPNSVVNLPVVDDASPHDYKNKTGGKDLGLTKLEYTVDPAYYYLVCDDRDNSGHANDVYLNEATFQVYAQIKVKGYFSPTEPPYEGNLGVEIKLGSNTDLQNIVFEYIQQYLTGVDVLQQIIDTRIMSGMDKESGNFNVPTSYLGFNIEYSQPIIKTKLQKIVDTYNSADMIYPKLIEWATGKSLARADTIYPGFDTTTGACVADGEATISQPEAQAITMYASKKEYIDYIGEWEKYINNSNRDINKDLSYGIIKSIDLNGSTCAINIDLTKLASTDKQIPVDVTIYMPSAPASREVRELHFTVPGAIHNDLAGFADKEVFYSVKMQVWQQLPQNELMGLAIDTVNGQATIDTTGKWNYILLRDINFCDNLVFENGSASQRLLALLGWAAATNNNGQMIKDAITIDVSQGSTDSLRSVANKQSNGRVDISSEEKSVIDAFFAGDAGFSSIWSQAINSGTTWKPNGRANALLDVKLFVNQLNNLNYAFPGENPENFATYLGWASSNNPAITGVDGSLADNYWRIYHSSSGSALHDSNAKISLNEAGTIKHAYTQLGYKEFSKAWDNALLALNLNPDGFYAKDNGTYPNKATQADMDSLITNGASNKDKMFCYTGETTANYVHNRVYKLVASGTTYIFKNTNYTMKNVLEETIVAQIKKIILNTWEAVSNWAESDTAPHTVGIDYLPSDIKILNSDGKSTFSADEIRVIKSFFETVLPTNLPTPVISSINPITNNTAKVDVFTNTGINDIYVYWNSKHTDSSTTTMLSKENMVSSGIGVILSRATKHQVGSLYLYTGLTSSQYINNTIYELTYRNSTYAFVARTDIIRLNSADELTNVLKGADATTIGKTYLYTGVSTPSYIHNVTYIVSYNKETNKYSFVVDTRVCETYANEKKPLYYAYVASLDRSTYGLNEFTSLKELYVYGSASPVTPIFTSVSTASAFFNKLTIYNHELTKLVLQNCSLDNISSIATLKYLTHLDLFGNAKLTDITPINKLIVANLNFVDVSNTNINMGYSATTLSNIYYSYKKAHNVDPAIWYTLSNVRTQYIPTLTMEQQTILDYLYRLKEINTITTKYLQLTTKVVVTSTLSYDITWTIVSGANVELLTLANGAKQIKNNSFGTGNPSNAVIRASITVGGVTFSRDFEVKLGS